MIVDNLHGFSFVFLRCLPVFDDAESSRHFVSDLAAESVGHFWDVLAVPITENVTITQPQGPLVDHHLMESVVMDLNIP